MQRQLTERLNGLCSLAATLISHGLARVRPVHEERGGDLGPHVKGPHASLWGLREGELGVVSGFTPDLPEQFRMRLMALGFVPGASIVCVRRTPLGAPRLYRTQHTIYALDHQVANCVSLA